MPLIADTRVEADILRSMTCVAPIDLRNSACLREAVVMMGENPESFASWIAERLILRVNSHQKKGHLHIYPPEFKIYVQKCVYRPEFHVKVPIILAC